MIDWPVVLSALALLPVVALLYFVGCGSLIPAPDDPGEPDPPPATTTSPPTTKPPGVGPVVGPYTGGPTLPPPVPTLLQLKLAPNLNVIPPGALDDQVESVTVSWTLTTKPGQPDADPLPLDEAIVRKDGPPRLFLNPAVDPPATRSLTPAQISTYGKVLWQATVVTKSTVGGVARPDFSTTVATADISIASVAAYRLEPNWTIPLNFPRHFDLVAESPVPASALSAPATRLQLNPAADINTIVAGGRPYKVVSIKVEWTLSRSTGGRPPQLLHETIVRSDLASTPRFLDPKLDSAAMWDLSPDPGPPTGFDQVTCGCVVTSMPATGPGGPEPSPLAVSTPVFLKLGAANVFVLQPDWSIPALAPRRFKVVFQA
jgi:hypothetical protein